ncbi:MAG TPA: hypothetical protein VF510_23900 [Ktedonobacterales bacterium]
MQCWQCGRSVREGAKLCIFCGAKLADDEEQEAPRALESRSGRRSSEPDGHRSAASRRDEDDLGDAPPYGESEEYAASNQPRDGDDRHAHRERAPSHPRDNGDYPDRSVNYPRPRESRSRDPMDDPRAPIQRARGTMPPSGRERREPNRHDDARYGAKDDPSGVGDDYRRGKREHAPEDHPRRASRSGRDDDWGGGGEPRSSRGSRREGRGDDYDSSRDYGRAAPPSSSGSRRRSDMEYGGGYDGRHERGSSRDRHAGRGPQAERDWERGEARGGYRGDARGAAHPQPSLDDSWGMPAAGGEQLGVWGSTLSEELPAPLGSRRGRDARGRSAPAGKGTRAGRADKEQRGGGGGRVALIFLVVLIVIGLIGAGVLVAPKLLSRFGGANGNGLDTQPPFATYTPGPTPTPPAKYVEYVSQQLHIALDYPKEWSKSEAPADAGKTDWIDTFTQPAPQAALLVEQSSGFDAIGNDELIHDEVLAEQSEGSTLTETTTTPLQALIGGEQWLRRDFDVTPKGGSKLHIGVLSCHHLGHGYVIVLISLPQNFVHDDQTTFQSILSTFRFVA